MVVNITKIFQKMESLLSIETNIVELEKDYCKTRTNTLI